MIIWKRLQCQLYNLQLDKKMKKMKTKNTKKMIGQFENVCNVNYTGYNSALHYNRQNCNKNKILEAFSRKLQNYEKFRKRKKANEFKNHGSPKKVKRNFKIMIHCGQFFLLLKEQKAFPVLLLAFFFYYINNKK